MIAYLATITVGVLKSVKSARSQTLTTGLLVLSRCFRIVSKRWHSSNVSRRILLIQAGRHLGSRYMGDGATRAHARRGILSSRHDGKKRRTQSAKHGPPEGLSSV